MPLIQRAHDYVKAHPGRLALGVAVEICSAAVFLDDTYDTKIGNAICADGAAAFVLGAGSSGPEIVRLHSHLDIPHREDVGFERRGGKLRIVLRKSIREVAGPLVERVVDGLLEEERIRRDSIQHWILHPGGRKVIDGVRRALGLDGEAVRHTKSVYRRYGNMSSPTVLFVLEECLRDGSPPAPMDLGILLAMGPGLAVEAALLRW
jgi:predicted naringenin-chalcone synthase